ncbi:SMP-30/gluconolactonase/LRE family protein [Thioalkalivibrio sp. XN279]|uniref:SMP-30/gluconolactonase/LRE family protein n=1 Tax=Thioalkalivibrio sp. XN279 TaxID=2714953 RepID=UPI00140C857F|nr:SMP-30/gluconolactonase/LRE family protein [Thioalkalivibrio sp. XN279]NHA13957.1 hypothetical protein [Thioalkalivibrio sp. XN279]
MKYAPYRLLALLVAPAVALAFAWPGTSAAETGCEPEGEYRFICGPRSAEDLVRIPGTEWIIASGMIAGAPMYLVDARNKTWSELYPGEAPRAAQDMETYGACPGAPPAGTLVSHGLNIRARADGGATLYVVGHGGREAIEVFDVDTSGEAPELTWRGCVPTPGGMAANSVASLADGSLLATIPLYPGVPIGAALAGNNTGAVYRWSPGDAGFIRVEGSELPYANGIEVSADGTEFYIASSGLLQVLAYANTNPTRLLRSSDTLAFVPDNLRMGEDGRLLTAGLDVEDPGCGVVALSADFKLEEFAACPRAFTVWSVDPVSMQGRALATSPAIEHFSNITIGITVGDELWIGIFLGDRIAYRSLAQAE